MSRFSIGLTDHLEGPTARPSREVFDEVAELVRLADALGAGYAWFTEHHAHAHQGHLPTPLLFALHMAGQTRSIRLGTAVICLNLHDALDVAEQVAVFDVLADGRTAVGFGSGSTPEEFVLFGSPMPEEATRHALFEEALGVVRRYWTEGKVLPTPSADLPGRCWMAVNSLGSAGVAGRFGANILFSHLRTVEEYRRYTAAYREAGGTGLVAANRPVYVGPDDATAFAQAEPALRSLWRRFRSEGKIPADTPEPARVEDLCGHPINFVVGGPESVARQLLDLHDAAPFDVLNVEVRWAGLSHAATLDSLRRLLVDVMPMTA